MKKHKVNSVDNVNKEKWWTKLDGYTIPLIDLYASNRLMEIYMYRSMDWQIDTDRPMKIYAVSFFVLECTCSLSQGFKYDSPKYHVWPYHLVVLSLVFIEPFHCMIALVFYLCMIRGLSCLDPRL